jgi:hypothetical protein
VEHLDAGSSNGILNTINGECIVSLVHENGYYKIIMSSHLGHTSTHVITKVKQRWAKIIIGWVTTQMTSMPGAVRRCTPILWTGKALERTPIGVIPPVCEKYCRTLQENKSLVLEDRCYMLPEMRSTYPPAKINDYKLLTQNKVEPRDKYTEIITTVLRK